jgi:hypothetical protein
MSDRRDLVCGREGRCDGHSATGPKLMSASALTCDVDST